MIAYDADLGVDKELFERQCELEMEGFEAGIRKYERTRQETLTNRFKDNTSMGPESRVMKELVLPLATAIFIAITSGPKRGGAADVRKARELLAQFDPYRLSYLTIRHCCNLIRDMPIQAAFVSLGKQIEKDLEYMIFQKKAGAYLSKIEESLKSTHLRHRHRSITFARHNVDIKDEDGNVIQTGIPDLNWPETLRMAVGKVLIEQAITKIGLVELADAVLNKTRRQRPFKTLRPTAKYQQLIEGLNERLKILQPITFPMLIPPKPWKDVYGGGFWTQYKSLRTKLIKDRVRKRLSTARRGKMGRVYKALNAIQETPYRINTAILDVMKEAQKTGMGGLPTPDKDLMLTPEFWSSPEEFKRLSDTKDPRLVDWKRTRAREYDRWFREQSQRDSLIHKLRLAERFKKEKEIYFAWNLDWRGRIYPIQPHINPQMDDSGRALLEFAHGKRLGEDGAYWLAVHGCNEFGEADKEALDNRVQWVLDHEEAILDSAETPLDGERFWTKADKPFQFLAFCFEWAGYKRDGVDFVSYLPVQMDGSCSGLQHYSALLRDHKGGAAVNLTPNETPADVYQQVACVVSERLNEMAAKKGGDKGKFARMWLKHMNRSVAKRNVMTYCYGATLEGFKDQLVAYVDKEDLDLMGCDKYKACRFLAQMNLEAIQTTLTAAAGGMEYLQKIAKFAAQNDIDLKWTAPSGYTCLQVYNKTKTKRIASWFGGVRLQLTLREDVKKKDVAGNVNGIAPNFVHSMDASHLMLTTLRCVEVGGADGTPISFSYIHDSFGCHASDLPVMNRVLRETFVEMYSEDLLDKFTAEVREQMPADLLVEFDELTRSRPPVGTLDLTAVWRSAFFFA